MKLKVLLFLYVLFILSLQSTGYDLYAHSLIYYYNSEQITHSYTIFNQQIVVPRYGLLSMMYEGTRQFGLPTGWVVVILVYIPVKDILFNLEWLSGFSYKKIISITVCTIPIYFYSGLTLVVLWLMAASITSRSFYVLGSAFHPVGAILGALGTMVGGNKKSKLAWYILSYIVLLILSYLNTSVLTLFPSVSASNIKQHIIFNELIQLAAFAYEFKSNEINFVLFMILVSFMFRGKALRFVRYIRALFQMTGQLFWVPVLVSALFLNAMTRDLNSMLKALITLDISEPIYITWLDFGKRDLEVDFWRADDSRFKP